MNCKELYNIHLIDEELKKIERELKPKEFLHEMSSIRKQYEQLRTYYTEMKKDEADNEKNMSSLEIISENGTKELKEYEKQMYSSSSVKAIDGYQKSIDKLNKEIKDNDERIYEILDNLEDIKKRKEEVLEKSKIIKSEYQKRKAEYDIKVAELNKRKAELLEKRDKEVLNINEAIYNKYESIRKSKGYGVCIVKGEICSGCGMDVPYIIINEVRNTSNIVKCPNCGRFIYMEK